MLSPASACKSQSASPEFPLVIGLPSRTSAAVELLQHCSAPSSVIRRCLTSQRRTYWDYGHRPSPTAPIVYCLSKTSEISRFSIIEFPRMHRVSDSAGSVYDSLYFAASQCCLPLQVTRSAPRKGDFGALWLACVSPCQLLHVSPHDNPHMTRGHNG